MIKTLMTGAALVLLTTYSAHAEPLTLADALAKRAATSRMLKMASLDEQIADDSVRAQPERLSAPRRLSRRDIPPSRNPNRSLRRSASFETQDADYGFFSLSQPDPLRLRPHRCPLRPGAKPSREAVRFDGTKPRSRDFFSRR